MKKTYQIILIFCVVLILFAGLFLPELIKLYFDNDVENQNIQIETEEVYLTFSTSYIKTLDLFGTQHTTTEYTGNTSLTDQNAITIAIQFVMSLTEIWDGFADAPSFDCSSPLLLTTTEKPARTSIFWCVTFVDGEDDSTKVWIDDRTGKIVALEAVPITTAYSADFVFVAEEITRLFLEQAVLTSSAKTNYQQGQDRAEIVLTSPNGDQEETCTIGIYMENGLLYSNK